MVQTLQQRIFIKAGRTMSGDSSPQRAWNILLVEDDIDIAGLVSLHLQDIGAHTRHIERGDEALVAAMKPGWDLMILDLRLPGIGGLEICRQLRQRGINLPILMLTSKSTELDRVLGLELGADDYVTKPFSPLELTARVKAILRRLHQNQNGEPGTAAEVFQCGNLLADERKRQVVLSGKQIELTSREFDLLVYFMRNPGQVFRRSELLDQVWGYGHEGYEHTVNSHINRLRAKIENDPAKPARIITVWGVGYKFSEEMVA
jgi:DNA-binding response OmpR family regulator